MKKRLLTIAALTLSMSMLSGTAAFAAEWQKQGKDWCYYYDDGTAAKNAWAEDAQGEKYWLNNDSKMLTNDWVYYDGAWYYCDGSGKVLKNQYFTKNDEMYWLGEDGKMLADDWHQDAETGKWYYFTESGSAVRKGWRTIDGADYYFMNSGAMATDAGTPDGGHVGPDGKRTR